MPRSRQTSPQQLSFDEHSSFATGDFPQYLRVSEREERAEAQRRELVREGRVLHPVSSTARGIATTLWGRAFCAQLEGYPELEHRLSRARSYVRHGSVVDLVIDGGRVTALVQGNELYTVAVEIGRMAEERWQTLVRESEGHRAPSLDALLRGELPAGLATVLARRDAGLMPSLNELRADCTCPDASPAGLCKHACAALYGVGVRIDEEPRLLFALRGVDPCDVVSAGESAKPTESAKEPLAARRRRRSEPEPRAAAAKRRGRTAAKRKS